MFIGLAILVVLAILIPLLVLVHEFGHFALAKWFGIKVEEFGFGFPPRIWKKKKNDTIYSINLLPLGGFVKLFGEDEAGAGRIKFKSSEVRGHGPELKRAFFARPPHERALVVVAGVIMNILLAIIIYYFYLGASNFRTEIPRLNDFKFFAVDETSRIDIVIGDVAGNSPAEKAGIKPYSKIIAVNNKLPKDMKEFIAIVNSNKGKEIVLSWQELETNKKMTKSIIPRMNPPKNEGALGIGLSPFEIAILSYDSPTQKFFSGIVHPFNLMAYNLSVLSQLISISFEQKTVAPISEGVSGPVGIVVFVSQILKIAELKEVVLQLLNLAGLLSISLAFFNILPIPALDGGRLFFILIEMVIGKKVPQKYEQIAHTIGFALLITLVILVTFKDISRSF